MGDLTTNFSGWEFECSCGCNQMFISSDHLTMLENVRKIYNRSMRILSGCRCLNHNTSIKGASKSAHIPDVMFDSKSFASDIFVANPADAYRLVNAAYQAGVTRIRPAVSRNFVHLDNHPTHPAPHLGTYE